MVDELGMDGNSSDESEGENHVIRRKGWRSKEVGQLLQFIDANRNVTNAYGNPLPGGRPHARLRTNHAPMTRHPTPACLPKNFYDKTWYDTLTPFSQKQLAPKPSAALPGRED